jgi:hypothetical protein
VEMGERAAMLLFCCRWGSCKKKICRVRWMTPVIDVVDILRERELAMLLLFIGLLWNRTMFSFVFSKSNADGGSSD